MFDISNIEPFRTLVLMGGGLDSSYLAVNIAKSNTKEQIIGIHFDYGQPASDLEREAVTRIGELIDIEVLYGNFEFSTVTINHEIKGRNLLLIMAAIPFAIKENCSQIALGIHKGNNYYDTTEHFLRDAKNLMDGYFGGAVQISAPLINLVKSEIYELAKNDIPFDLIYSCEIGSKPPCGECPSCRDRRLMDAYN